MDDFDSLIPTPLVEVPDLPDSELGKRPCLVVLAGPNQGQVIVLDCLCAGSAAIVGRRGHAEVELDDDTVSRSHCRLTMDTLGQVRLEDLGSRNRTLRNAEAVVGARVLRDGDRIQVGETTILKFSLQDGLEVGFQQQLYNAALRDSLTRLYSRSYLVERCEQAFFQARLKEAPLAFLMLDLDHFKRVNDRFGHPAGDRALTHVAQQILRPVGPLDVCGRYGGEEFGVIAVNTEIAAATALADRIRHEVVEGRFEWEGKPVPLSISVGVAALPDRTIVRPHQIIQFADEALYRAKREGRNQTRVYHEGHAD